ncbi:MAG: 5-oxoprolinase subunit PxpB [Planctomycetales bacterium]|nr:5-oxoprolinase subunit PxpB [Planctomycetales bacterium]
MLKTVFPTFATLCDRAVVVHLGDQIDAPTFRAIRSLVKKLEASPPAGMIEFVPAFTTVAVYYDPLRTSEAELCSSISSLAPTLDSTDEPKPRVVEIPVCYGGEFGPDLQIVAKHTGLIPSEVARIHSEGEYLVHMIGFAPGFPYLGGMSPRIAAPRRSSPRLKIPAGSVGIAGEQTGIYPLETPGGWQLIGRTPLVLFRPEQDPPTLLQAGDIVRFRSVTPDQFRQLSEQPA